MNTKRKNKMHKHPAIEMDLSKVEPLGLVDVAIVKCLELAVSHVPELVLVLQNNKGVIHMSINEQFGPHNYSVDLAGLIKAAAPFMPLFSATAQQILIRMNAK